MNVHGPAGVRIGSVVMHHPSRVPQLHRTLRSTQALAPRTVTDPDPTGPPSPLRTAKLAWAAVTPGATHHLVFQDDVTMGPASVGALPDAVAARPTDIISLFVPWGSPNNSYAARQAAVAGSPWAALVPGEFVPAQGLLMPTEKALDLADYLGRIPDTTRDDDALIDRFCRERDYPVFATVPHLVEHSDDVSVAGNESHGVRRAAVPAEDWTAPPGYWTAPPVTDKGGPMRARGSSDWQHVISFRSSSCVVRFIVPHSGEPPRHTVTNWYQWSSLVGAPPELVLDDMHRSLATGAGPALAADLALGRVPAATAAEMWAACFLLGLDTARCAPEGLRPDLLVREGAVASWVDCGLSARDDRTVSPSGRAALVALGLAALAAATRRAEDELGGPPLGDQRRKVLK